MAVALSVLFYSLIFTLMSINAATFPTPSRPTQLTIKLIHRDSILSPYNNPNENPAHRVQRGINISIARLAYLQEKIRSHHHIILTKLTFFPAMIFPILCST